MKELKYKNALNAVLYGACFVTVAIVFCCCFGIAMTYFFEDARDFSLVMIIGASLIAGAWIIAGIVIVFQGTVVVTEQSIKYYRGKVEKWSIGKEDIKECVYNKAHWYDFLMPISAINVFILNFKLNDGTISRKKYCSLSFKKVKQMCDMFHYPLRDIDTVHEQ